MWPRLILSFVNGLRDFKQARLTILFPKPSPLPMVFSSAEAQTLIYRCRETFHLLYLPSSSFSRAINPLPTPYCSLILELMEPLRLLHLICIDIFRLLRLRFFINSSSINLFFTQPLSYPLENSEL